MGSSLNFENAVKKVLAHEGGYVNDPRDSGGETNFGISKRSYPNLKIRDLTKEDAIAIYLKDFWTPNNYGQINNSDIAEKVFDMSVLLGAKAANQTLQKTLNKLNCSLSEDGILGPLSLKAINSADSAKLLSLYKAQLEIHFKEIVKKRPKNEVFLNGWLRRVYA